MIRAPAVGLEELWAKGNRTRRRRPESAFADRRL